MTMKIEYYKGPSTAADAQVSAAEAPRLKTYTRAYRSEQGTLSKTELFDGGVLVEVNYYDGGREAIIAEHSRTHPGTRFRIWTTLEDHPNHVWKYVYAFDQAGKAEGFTKILADRDQRELMQIDIDPNHRITRITKYDWDEANALRYLFEYDDNGRLYSGYDVIHGDDASLADVKDDLADPEFYQSGHALPRVLGVTAIPSDPH